MSELSAASHNSNTKTSGVNKDITFVVILAPFLDSIM